MAQITIRTISELTGLEETLATAAATTLATLRTRLADDVGLTSLAVLKFATPGCDPLDPARGLHLIEQINQTFTYLTSIQGARWLLHHHPGHSPFVLNLGTAPGSDIISEDGSIAAEVFAATNPDSNDKLRKDVAKVRAVEAVHRYVFYLSPVAARPGNEDGVRVIRVDHECLHGLTRDKGQVAEARPVSLNKPSTSSATKQKRRPCPGCVSHEFQRWPWGWDAHAAHTCNALVAVEPQERKAEYRRRFAQFFDPPT